MATTTFDTLKFANTLKAAGVPDKQAEAQASVLGEALSVNFKELATKDDLAAVKDDLIAALGSLRAELHNDLRQKKQRVDTTIDAPNPNAKIDNPKARHDASFNQLVWIMALNIVLLGVMLLKLM